MRTGTSDGENRTPAISRHLSETDPAWLGVPHRIHVVGIGGAGMSAIASVLHSMGHLVSGSDIKKTKTLERLGAVGISCSIGHDEKNVDQAEAVVVSTAIAESNPEVTAARSRGIPVWHRSQILASIVSTRVTIAVAGTHGKTSTSSMLALILARAGWDPSFLIGGDLNEVGTNAKWGSGEHVVVEADESDGTFLLIRPRAAIVTNIEADHLEFWGGEFANLKSAFRDFVSHVDDLAVLCADDPEASSLVGIAPRTVTYGTGAEADFRFEFSGRGLVSLARGGKKLFEADIALPGRHFASNAAAAAALAIEIGVPPEVAGDALSRFEGVERRFQFKGEGSGIRVYDDYAHLPSEIRETIRGARQLDPRRVVAVFQPHRYSRTESLFRELGAALSEADLVILTDVFAGPGEDPIPGVGSELVRGAIEGTEVVYVPRSGDVVSKTSRELVEGDLVVTMGAGDITAIGPELVVALRKRGE